MKKLILILLAILILTSAVSALKIGAGPGKMFYRVEVGESVNKTITINNENNFTVNVTVSVEGPLMDIVILEETEFLLEQATQRKLNFEVTPTEAKFYKGRIPVVFRGGGEQGGLMASIDVSIDASDENTTPTPTEEPPKTNNTPQLLAIFLPILAIIIIMSIVLTINKKKS